MKLSITISALAFTSYVLSAPSPSNSEGWAPIPIAKRSESFNSSPLKRAWRSSDGTNAANVVDSTNWSGAIQSATGGQPITSVAATFAVPTPSVPQGQGPNSYTGGSWIGLGGASANTSLWQAGISWSISTTSGSAQYSFGVWYEWLPNGGIGINNFQIQPGHVINIQLNADTPSSGAVIITDKTTGQHTSITTHAPNPTATLSGVTAEWIVEDPSVGNGQTPFPNYGIEKFTGCATGNLAGQVGTAAGSLLTQLINSNGQVISKPTLVSSTEVDCTYV